MKNHRGSSIFEKAQKSQTTGKMTEFCYVPYFYREVETTKEMLGQELSNPPTNEHSPVLNCMNTKAFATKDEAEQFAIQKLKASADFNDDEFGDKKHNGGNAPFTSTFKKSGLKSDLRPCGYWILKVEGMGQDETNNLLKVMEEQTGKELTVSNGTLFRKIASASNVNDDLINVSKMKTEEHEQKEQLMKYFEEKDKKITGGLS